MGNLDRVIRRTQFRLWLNRWFRLLGWSICLAAAAWTLVWLADRLLVPGRLPMDWVALGAAVVGMVGSFLWMFFTRERPLAAAMALDEAAGLQERVSTGLVVRAEASSRGPFAQAVVADAEQAVAGLSPRRLIPVRWTRSLSWGSAMLAAALLSLLLPEWDLLGRKKAQAQQNERLARLAAVQAAVARPAALIEEIEKKHPDLNDKPPVPELAGPRRSEHDPDALRRETVKKLDRLQDALKEKAQTEQFRALEEVKKRLQQLGEPRDPQDELHALMSALARNDFDQARRALEALQQRLAQQAGDGRLDPQAAEATRKRLEELSKKLKEAGRDQRSQRELQNAGLSENEAGQIQQALAQADAQQLEKMARELAERLQNQGMTQEQARQMLEKMRQRQNACQQCQGLGDMLGQAAEALSGGDATAAAGAVAEAGGMLGEMEQLEQELHEVEAELSQLNEAREEMEEASCFGGESWRRSRERRAQGEGMCEGGGVGPGIGTGRGGGTTTWNEPPGTTAMSKRVAAKARFKGQVIGQRYLESAVLSDRAAAEFAEAARAAEIEATDALNKDRIPRAYRRAVKNYFDRLGDAVPLGGGAKPGGDAPGSGGGETASGGGAEKPKEQAKKPEAGDGQKGGAPGASPGGPGKD